MQPHLECSEENCCRLPLNRHVSELGLVLERATHGSKQEFDLQSWGSNSPKEFYIQGVHCILLGGNNQACGLPCWGSKDQQDQYFCIEDVRCKRLTTHDVS